MSQPMSPVEVNRLHSNADTDSSTSSAHHTLGPGHNQASPGDHLHDGRTSKLPLAGDFPSFPLIASNPPTQAEVQAALDALIRLGAGT